MSEILSMEEIEKRYAPEWVLINNPRTDENFRVVGGEVVFTGKNSDDLYRKASEMDLKDIAVFYLGTWPEDVALLL